MILNYFLELILHKFRCESPPASHCRYHLTNSFVSKLYCYKVKKKKAKTKKIYLWYPINARKHISNFREKNSAVLSLWEILFHKTTFLHLSLYQMVERFRATWGLEHSLGPGRKGVEVVSCCWSAQGLEIRCWKNSATAKYQLLQFPKNTAGGENLVQVKNVSNYVSENNGGALCL